MPPEPYQPIIPPVVSIEKKVIQREISEKVVVVRLTEEQAALLARISYSHVEGDSPLRGLDYEIESRGIKMAPKMTKCLDWGMGPYLVR